MMKTKDSMKASPEDSYTPKETEQRREAALKKMLATPPKPHASKGKLSPRKRKAKKA